MTELQRDLADEEMRAMGWFNEDGTTKDVFKTVEQGASTTLWAATSTLLEDRGRGSICEDCNIGALNPPEACSMAFNLISATPKPHKNSGR